MVKCQGKGRNQELGKETKKDRAEEMCLSSARAAVVQEETRKGQGWGFLCPVSSLVPAPWKTPTSPLLPHWYR